MVPQPSATAKGERKQAIILFADLKGFTQWIEVFEKIQIALRPPG
jgi:class 3 adenylate cyclase